MPSQREEKGFTLIELLITIGVIALALVGIIGTNLAIRQGTESVFERTVAIQDANQVIEQMRNAAKTAPVNFQTTVLNAGATAAAVVGSMPANYNENITVTTPNAGANPLDVTVTVTWNQNGLRAATAAVRTFITRRT